MAATNLNRVIITGNLTRDPELRNLPSGTAICNLRVAVNSRRKDNQTGEWVDKPNYFNVKVWGPQGENCAQYLSKGRPVAIDGRLDWSEWEDQQGNKRQSVDIIADSVQFLGSREGSENGGRFTPQSDLPADTGDLQRAPTGGRRKPCPFCRDKVDVVDYRDLAGLRRAISDKGKIRSSRVTGSCRRHQSQLANAVKRARELRLLPYVADR